MKRHLLLPLSTVLLVSCTANSGGNKGTNEQTPRSGAANLVNALKGGDSWILRQKLVMGGDQTFFITPQAIKLVNPGMGLTYIVRGSPEWNVVVINDQTKLCYETTIDELQKQRAEQAKETEALAAGLRGKQTPYRPGKTESVAGLEAVQYTSESVLAVNSQAKAFGLKPSKTVTQVWLTKAIDIPQKMQLVVTRDTEGLGLPSDGMVVKVVVDDGEKSTMLDTIKAERADVPASTFEVPTGLTKASSEMAVVMGESEAKSTSEMNKRLSDTSKPMSNAELLKKYNQMIQREKRSLK